jgi:membrane protease YdiL (CAAX protease family)
MSTTIDTCAEIEVGKPLNKLSDWIGNHQLTTFFVLTFLITWGLGFSYWAVMREGRFLLAPLLFFATCGPALAGIIINMMTGSPQPQGKSWISWLVFVAVWFVAVIIFVSHMTIVNGSSVSPVATVVLAVSALPVAFIVSMAYSRFPLVKRFPQSRLRQGGALWWIILAFGLIPALSVISIFVSALLGRSLPPTTLPATGIGLLGWIGLKFLYQFFFFNGTGEEVGWRGFALPRLQRRLSPLTASLILGLVWVPWHLFLWQAEGKPIDAVPYWTFAYLIHIPAAVIICWLFNRSHGRVAVAGIAHAAANTALALPLFGSVDAVVLAVPLYGCAVVIVLADRMWQRLPMDHPAVHNTVKMKADTVHPLYAVR